MRLNTIFAHNLILIGSGWHLIVGGVNGTDMEAFNYVTGKNCSLPNKLPAEISGLINLIHLKYKKTMSLRQPFALTLVLY